MSKNIYELKEDLRLLLETIEEAEGEITEEIGDQLKITEEQMGERIMDYYGVVKSAEANNAMLKDERERLANRMTSNEKRISILKSKIFDAVNEFGYVGPSGNKKIDLESLKLYTISKDKLEIEDEDNFHDPRFCHVPFNIPSDMEFIKKIYEFAVASHPNKTIIKDLNPTYKVIISRTKVKAALTLNKKVPGAKLGTTSYVVMR